MLLDRTFITQTALRHQLRTFTPAFLDYTFTHRQRCRVSQNKPCKTATSMQTPGFLQAAYPSCCQTDSVTAL